MTADVDLTILGAPRESRLQQLLFRAVARRYIDLTGTVAAWLKGE